MNKSFQTLLMCISLFVDLKAMNTLDSIAVECGANAYIINNINFNGVLLITFILRMYY